MVFAEFGKACAPPKIFQNNDHSGGDDDGRRRIQEKRKRFFTRVFVFELLACGKINESSQSVESGEKGGTFAHRREKSAETASGREYQFRYKKIRHT